jgi:hypothetical protein
MKYAPLLNNDHQSSLPVNEAPAPSSKISNMLSSLKDSANKASTSVRSGLGLPSGESQDGTDNSEASGIMDDMSEYCPKLTFQQVNSFVSVVVLWFGHTQTYLMSILNDEIIAPPNRELQDLPPASR